MTRPIEHSLRVQLRQRDMDYHAEVPVVDRPPYRSPEPKSRGSRMRMR
jgi:hypothetical protein